MTQGILSLEFNVKHDFTFIGFYLSEQQHAQAWMVHKIKPLGITFRIPGFGFLLVIPIEITHAIRYKSYLRDLCPTIRVISVEAISL